MSPRDLGIVAIVFYVVLLLASACCVPHTTPYELLMALRAMIIGGWFGYQFALRRSSESR